MANLVEKLINSASTGPMSGIARKSAVTTSLVVLFIQGLFYCLVIRTL
jgi:hypothetical protein